MKRLMLVAGLVLAWGALAQSYQDGAGNLYPDQGDSEPGRPAAQDPWSRRDDRWSGDQDRSRTGPSRDLGGMAPWVYSGDETPSFGSSGYRDQDESRRAYPDAGQNGWMKEDSGYRPASPGQSEGPRRSGALHAPRDGQPLDPGMAKGATDAFYQGYRFRGDPAFPPGGDQGSDADREFRFRPLTDQERERGGASSQWRPLDDAGRSGSGSNLFESMTPSDSSGDWNQGQWSRPQRSTAP